MGTRFTFNTDHSALRWLMSITEPSGRLMRWRLRLTQFDYEFSYKKGNLKAQGVALSHLGTRGEALPVEEEDEMIPGFLLHDNDQDLDLMSQNVCDSLLVSNGEDP